MKAWFFIIVLVGLPVGLFVSLWVIFGDGDGVDTPPWSTAPVGTQLTPTPTPATPAITPTPEDNDALKVEIDSLQEEITDLSNQLSSSQSEASASRNQLEDANTALKEASTAIAYLESAKSALESELALFMVTADTLQKGLDQLMLPSPIESEDLHWEGFLQSRRLASRPLDLKAFQEVKGEFICLPVPCSPYIQDSEGNNVFELDVISQRNFRFVAQKTGHYSLVILNPYRSGEYEPRPHLQNHFSVTYQIVTWFSDTSTDNPIGILPTPIPTPPTHAPIKTPLPPQTTTSGVWEASITITGDRSGADLNSGISTLAFGAHPDATAEGDIGFDKEIPPAPPQPSIVYYFSYPNNDRGFTKLYKSKISPADEKQWPLVFNAIVGAIPASTINIEISGNFSGVGDTPGPDEETDVFVDLVDPQTGAFIETLGNLRDGPVSHTFDVGHSAFFKQGGFMIRVPNP